MNKILILGGSGLLGTAIARELNGCDSFEVYATFHSRPIHVHADRNFQLNIEDLDRLQQILAAVRPQIVVSCLRGDFGQQLAAHIEIAEYLEQCGGRLFFFSTTNVFDNDLHAPHFEHDRPDSQSDYGQYKIECEKAISERLHENACILRIPQVWGSHSPRMAELLDSLHHNKNIVTYPKLFHNTNTDVMIARQMRHIIARNLSGIFHLAPADVINHKVFLAELTKRLGFEKARLQESPDMAGCFALLSHRTSEFPVHLRFTNQSVIDYLFQSILGTP